MRWKELKKINFAAAKLIKKAVYALFFFYNQSD
jgi:hypothetical protein